MCEWVAEGLKLTDTTEMPNAQNTEKEKHIDIHRLHNHRHTHYRPSMHLVETFTTWLQFAEWKHLCLQKSRERKKKHVGLFSPMLTVRVN